MEDLEIIQGLERLSPVLETTPAIVFCIVMSSCLTLGFFVQKSIFKLLARREGRNINRMIYIQQVLKLIT